MPEAGGARTTTTARIVRKVTRDARNGRTGLALCPAHAGDPLTGIKDAPGRPDPPGDDTPGAGGPDARAGGEAAAAAFRGGGGGGGGPAYPLANSLREAISAPSARLPSFAQAISASTAPKPAKVAKPQSVPAITRSRPTMSA